MELPKDATYNIMIHLDFKEIMILCTTHENYYNICHDMNFWVYKINYDFGTNFSKKDFVTLNGKKWMGEHYDMDVDSVIDPKASNTSFYNRIKSIYIAFKRIKSIIIDIMNEINDYDGYRINLINYDVIPYLPNKIKSTIYVNNNNNMIEFDYTDEYVIYYPVDDDVYNNQTYESSENEIYSMLFKIILYNPTIDS